MTDGITAKNQQNIDLINGYFRESQKSVVTKETVIPQSINNLCIMYFNECICNIKVFCRIKPLTPLQIGNGKKNIINFIDENSIELTDHKNKQQTFKLDKIYDSNTTQQQISNDLSDYIDNVLNGYSVTLFAYGATKSGKTYTLNGAHDTNKNPGICQRSIDYIFDIIKQKENISQSIEYNIKCGIFEIYNRQIKDLITNKDLGYDIKDESEIKDLRWTELKSENDYISLNEIAMGNRHRRPHQYFNLYVTRSHRITIFNVHCRNIINNIEWNGKLYMIDLTGSQRVRKSNASAIVMRECQCIGQSLNAFGTVLNAIQMNEKFVPYRNSILTSIMKNNFMNSNDVLIYSTIGASEDDIFETVSTLRLSQRLNYDYCANKKNNVCKKHK